jgi:hypothetical protein
MSRKYSLFTKRRFEQFHKFLHRLGHPAIDVGPLFGEHLFSLLPANRQKLEQVVAYAAIWQLFLEPVFQLLLPCLQVLLRREVA